MLTEIDRQVGELEDKTKEVQSLLKYASRAFVIEFAGTPKSGKSTAVEAVRHFFTRHHFRVHVLAERAAACPIPMKGHLFFNTWCATSMLSELLENVETDTDIIIVDRGILDALVWLQLQSQRGELTKPEAKTIEAFLLLERWSSLIDLNIVMSVDAQTAMKREIGQRITNKLGSIMNPDVLGTITDSVHASVRRYKKSFKHVHSVDTTKSASVRKSNTELASAVVDQLAEFLNPRILVVPRKAIEKLPLAKGRAFSRDAVRKVANCIRQHGKYVRRSLAEGNNSVVQIVAAGALTSENGVFLFQRKEADPKSKLYGRTTIWQGTHVAKHAKLTGLALVKNALMERITRSLFLSRQFSANAKGYCWDRDDEESRLHLGILYEIDIDNNHTANDLRKKEFRKNRGRGHDLAGQFISWNTLKSRRKELMLESWSDSVISGLDDFRNA